MADVSASFVAVDWGTSSFRLWVVSADGSVRARANGPFGMGTLTPADYGPLLEDQLQRLDVSKDVPVLISGMAGAKGGWFEVPYCDRDTDLTNLARYATSVPDQSRKIQIMPGLRQRNPDNVMRGEETQILGLLATQPGFDGIVALPGTHTKWVRLRKGRITDFDTCMTGEIFHLLSENSVLRHSVSVDGWDQAAFLGAVDEALNSPEILARMFFDLRAGALLSDLEPEAARARLSGLLIGAELAATQNYWMRGKVVLVGAPENCKYYSSALSRRGITTETTAAQDMTLAGLKLANAHIKEQVNAA